MTDHSLPSAPRVWTPTNSLRLMHFNTLCEIYQDNKHPDASFANRAPRIKSTIESFGCDVVSINECNPVTFFRQSFQHEYDIYFVSKGDDWRIQQSDMLTNNRTDDDGTAIMIKKGVVETISVHRIGCREPFPNTGVWARQFALAILAYHVPSKKTFWIVSMHMKANSAGNNECRRRVCHLNQILKELRGLVNTHSTSDTPVVFCGDFNAEPHYATIQYLANKRCVLDEVHHQTWFDFVSALQPHQCEVTYLFGEYGADHYTWNSVLDYIFVEKGKMVVTSVVPTPKRDDPSLGINSYNHCGSDHFPIAVELCFTLTKS
eukprot:PhF_6_TR5230/c1_g1_i2/m.7571